MQIIALAPSHRSLRKQPHIAGQARIGARLVDRFEAHEEAFSMRLEHHRVMIGFAQPFDRPCHAAADGSRALASAVGAPEHRSAPVHFGGQWRGAGELHSKRDLVGRDEVVDVADGHVFAEAANRTVSIVRQTSQWPWNARKQHEGDEHDRHGLHGHLARELE